MPAKRTPIAIKKQPTTNSLNAQVAPQARPNRERFFLRLTPFIIIAVALFAIVFVNYHLLKTSALGNLARSIAVSTHFPVARVDTSLISFSAVAEEQERIHSVVSRLYTQTPITLQEEFRLAFTKSVNSTLVQKGYAAHGITVSQAEVQHGFIQLFGTLPTSPEAQNLVAESMGLSVEEFTETLLTDYLLQQKFQSALLQDAELSANARKEADRLYAVAKQSPNTIAESVEKVTHVDASYQRGVIVRTGDLASQFSLIKDCRAGDVLPVIETADAFMVVVCQQQLPADATEEKAYWSVDEIIVQKTTYAFWLRTRLRNASVTVFPEGMSWQKECGSVVINGSGCNKQLSNGVNSEALQNLLESGNPMLPVMP